MASNTIYVGAPVESVYRTLLDAYAYPEWVVGAKKVRGTDDDWPKVGSSFHHKVRVAGRDRSEMLEDVPNSRVVLKVFARPLLVAVVSINLEQQGGRTKVAIHEEPAPDTFMRKLKIVLDPLIHVRNSIALRRFKTLVEGRAAAERSLA